MVSGCGPPSRASHSKQGTTCPFGGKLMSHRSRAKRVSGAARTYVLTLCSSIAILGGRGEVALAQGAENSGTPTKSATLEEVVVTGSRVGRSTFTTPNPVTVMDAKDIENLGITNV